MPSKPTAASCLILLAFLLGISAAAGHDVAAVRRAMEQFAGFPVSNDDEGPSSDFCVDSEGLQRQVHS
ncbi:unnamed protein product [Miscanthus lutarioriparius]|uniref:Uncharacterized protein n=1 Tax=Miscanthus lutarioriparius TaxID=422564 RepID=A0A811RAT5_9POAL|nr:unnamed protein product [Miscanthus lutarioriparius]